MGTPENILMKLKELRFTARDDYILGYIEHRIKELGCNRI
jgi:hypothetical protein